MRKSISRKTILNATIILFVSTVLIFSETLVTTISGADVLILRKQQSSVHQSNDALRESHTQDILWDNGLPNGFHAFNSQYKPTPQISREVVADVNAFQPWVVTSGDFRIIIMADEGPEAITGTNVFFYKNNDNNTPSMVRYAERTATFVGTYTGDTYFDRPEILINVTFDPVTLYPGKWWICCQPIIEFNTYWLESNLTGLGCYMSWPDLGYPKWTDDNDITYIGDDVDVSFRLLGYIPPQLEIGNITGGIGIHTNITNTGSISATDLTWTITVNGRFIFIGKNTSKMIPTIPPESTSKISAVVFGLGNSLITVKVSCAEGSTATREGKKIVFLIFVLGS